MVHWGGRGGSASKRAKIGWNPSILGAATADRY
jgi:hypothetical protein